MASGSDPDATGPSGSRVELPEGGLGHLQTPPKRGDIVLQVLGPAAIGRGLPGNLHGFPPSGIGLRSSSLQSRTQFRGLSGKLHETLDDGPPQSLIRGRLSFGDSVRGRAGSPATTRPANR